MASSSCAKRHSCDFSAQLNSAAKVTWLGRRPDISELATFVGQRFQCGKCPSGQIIIFHQPATFWGEVVWGRHNLTRPMGNSDKTNTPHPPPLESNSSKDLRCDKFSDGMGPGQLRMLHYDALTWNRCFFSFKQKHVVRNGESLKFLRNILQICMVQIA